MRCPHIDTVTKIYAEKNGDLNCSTCHGAEHFERPVRSNRKIWAGSQVDGKEGNREKVAMFGETLKARAMKQRQRFSEPKNPILRERIGLQA